MPNKYMALLDNTVPLIYGFQFGASAQNGIHVFLIIS